jgi:hypothetical protein
MFLKYVTPRHVVSQTCQAQAAHIQEREKVASLAHLACNVKFFVNGEPLETVTEFKCLKATSKTWFCMHQILFLCFLLTTLQVRKMN